MGGNTSVYILLFGFDITRFELVCQLSVSHDSSRENVRVQCIDKEGGTRQNKGHPKKHVKIYMHGKNKYHLHKLPMENHLHSYWDQISILNQIGDVIFVALLGEKDK